MEKIKKLVAAILAIIIAINVWMVVSTKNQLFTSIDDVPYNEVGLVLGTSNKNRNGGKNIFFAERMLTTANLFKKGKINKVIVSGDNRSKYYNEPLMMEAALIELGVPKEKIMLDTAGFRTIESIKNVEKKFGLKKITIITQAFHGYRALYISNYFHLDAQVMSTRRLPLKDSGNVRIREFFARIKAFVDIYLFS
ncbi:MAG: YdcF family protein [Cyclobacteriaceae bacterium]|nr:YdcF family protein [Cyclobacteriaceae bacterium]